MGYTKQTWAGGDTVTAAKLNHIEDGIAEAGGFKGLLLLPEGFNVTSHILGFLNYFVKDEGDWHLVGEQNDVFWLANDPTNHTLIDPLASSGLKVFWAIYPPDLDGVDLTFSGGINSTATTVYDNDGGSFNGYELTGLAFVTAVAI